MTLSASDSFKRWKLWVNVWCITVCVCVCLCACRSHFFWEKKQPFSSYQGATRTGPITSHCWAINVELTAFQRKSRIGVGGCVCGAVCAFPFFACLLPFFFSSFSINLSYCTIRMQGPVAGIEGLQSIILIVYLNDRNKLTWQQLIQTTSHGDGSEGRWRGEIEGRTDKWKGGREGNERGGPGLARRPARSVRAIQDKVVQGLMSCLTGSSGGFVIGWEAVCVCVCGGGDICIK